MDHLYTRCCLLLLIALQANVFCQQRSPVEKENHAKRSEWFAKRKQDPAIPNIEKARWDACLQSQTKLMQSSKAPVASWQSLGPVNQGGRIISHAFDPFDSNTLWVGAASGGLWKTTDGAATWTPMTDDIPNLAIGAVAIQPQNPSVMLLGTGEGYLLSSWLQYGIGVLRSTDGGNTWLPTSLMVDDSLQFACLGFAWDPVNTNNVYLSTTFGVYVSADAGLSWTKTLNGIGTSIVINKKLPQNIYASLQDYTGSTGGIYHSSDHGLNWTLLSGGLPPSSDIGFTSLAICDSFPSVIYAGVSTPASHPTCGTMQGFYKTSDGGASWSSVNTGGTDFYCYPPPFNTICQGWYGNMVYVDAADPDHIFAGGIYLYETTDGGATWNYSDYAPGESPAWMHPDHHSFGISPFNNQVMYSFNDGGVYKSINGGTTWEKRDDGLVTTQFYGISSSPLNPNLMIGGTQDNGVFYNTSVNVNQAWLSSIPGDGFHSVMDPLDADTWYTGELFNGRLKTTDGGATYDTIENGIVDPTAFIIPLAMDPHDNQVLYTGTDVNFYKTTNGGALWIPVSSKPYITVIGIDKIHSDTLYICNDPAIYVSYLYRSTDGGASFYYIGEPGNKITDIETSPVTAGTVYLSRGSYTPGQQVFRSVNAGISWQNITGDLPAIPVNSLVIDPNNPDHIYAGTDLGVYLTTNGGLNWNAFNDGLPLVMVTDMHYYSADSSIRIGSHGRGVWKTRSSLATSVKGYEVELSEMNAFPNPATEEVNISYTLKEDAVVIIKIYNSLGQEIRELSHSKKIRGQHVVRWNLGNSAGQKAAPGIYYVRMIRDGMAGSLKLVIQ